MPFPQTIEELEACGYKKRNDGECRGCGAPLTWWLAPQNKFMPMNRGTATVHWSTCPKADDFRKKGKG